MPTWFGYKTNEELAAEAAAKKAAEDAAAKQAEKIRRELAATKFQNEQLNYKLKGELPGSTEQAPSVQHNFLRRKPVQTTSSVSTQKSTEEAGAVTASSYTFIGSRMFQDRVVRKNEKPPVTEKNALKV